MSHYLDKLSASGVDVSGTMDRFMNNEDLYKRILKKFLSDTSFADATKAKEEGRDEDAQMYIHTLKGVSANLGLTPIFSITDEMMQHFRDDNLEAAYGLFDSLKEAYNKFVALINEI